MHAFISSTEAFTRHLPAEEVRRRAARILQYANKEFSVMIAPNNNKDFIILFVPKGNATVIILNTITINRISWTFQKLFEQTTLW